MGYQWNPTSRPQIVPTCERELRVNEVEEMGVASAGSPHINAPGGFILPDNNAGKSVVARAQLFPIPSINLGGSFVWGQHPAGDASPLLGQSSVDFRSAATSRAELPGDVREQGAPADPARRVRARS